MANVTIGRVAVSHNTQFAPADAMSSEVVLTVGNNDGHKAVVTAYPKDDSKMLVKFIARGYGYPVYEYLIRRDSLVHVIIDDITNELDCLSDILDNNKDVIAEAKEYGLEYEVISSAFEAMISGESAATALLRSRYDWDV